MSADQPKPKTGRMHWIDLTKGLAILGIFLFHFFQNYPDRITLVTALDRLGAKVGYAGVDIFFVMAGFNVSYILALKSVKNNPDWRFKEWKSWLIKRLDRIYPSYGLAVLFSLLLYQLFRGGYEIESLPIFILNLVGFAGYQFQTINPGFWFFTVILQAYLVTPLIFHLCGFRPGKILAVAIVGGGLTKLACLLVDNTTDLYWYLLQNDFLGSYFFQYGLGLYWGIIFFNHRNRFRNVDYIWTLSVFVAGAIGYGYLTYTGVDIIYMEGFDILFTPLFFLACYQIFHSLTKHKEKLLPPLSMLSLMGIYSYQIYLIHQPLLFVTLPRLNRTLPGNSELKILTSLAIAAILLTIYVLTFTEVEKFLRKWIGRLKNRPAQ